MDEKGGFFNMGWSKTKKKMKLETSKKDSNENKRKNT